jgi:hypothetical protein
MESIWEWMRNNQSKFNKNLPKVMSLKALENKIPPKKAHIDNLTQDIKKEPQKSLDCFIRSNSILFDETFTQEDFALITREWKQKNLIMN